MTAPTAPNFSINPLEGVSFSQTYTITASTPEYPAAPLAVGTHTLGTNGSEYVFAKASVALVQYQACALDPTYLVTVPLTITLVSQQQEVGIPQVALAAGDYGWFAIRGENIGVLAKKGSLANVKLYVSGTSPGTLTSTSVRTSALVTGIVLTTSSTSAMGATRAPVVANATWIRALL
jgi:hypothetical protein